MELYNPQTKRWVSATGKVGKQLIQLFGKEKLSSRLSKAGQDAALRAHHAAADTTGGTTFADLHEDILELISSYCDGLGHGHIDVGDVCRGERIGLHAVGHAHRVLHHKEATCGGALSLLGNGGPLADPVSLGGVCEACHQSGRCAAHHASIKTFPHAFARETDREFV